MDMEEEIYGDRGHHLHKRVHELERWQVGVDYFMKGQDDFNTDQKEINASFKKVESKMNILTGAVFLAMFVIPLIIKFIA